MDPLTRFAADLARVLPEGLPPGEPLALAVSGGPDSMALLWLAATALPGRVIASTVDHGLRAAAAAEAELVAIACARLDVPHRILRLGPERTVPVSNLQERARLARYRLLGEWAAERGSSRIATAHHRDDVAESFLMRAARGAGVKGLAAMPATRRNDGPGYRTLIVRPLLAWSRAELAAIVAQARLRSAIDPSNADPRFDRARIRSLLSGNPDLPPDRLARAAANLRDAEDALEWVMERERAARLELTANATMWLRPDGLPFELKRRLVVSAVETVRLGNGMFDEWRSTAVPELTRKLEGGKGGMVADVQARVVKERWHFRPSPPRRGK